MKLLVALWSAALVGLSLAEDRGCIHYGGSCIHECEEGTHYYAPGCIYPKEDPTCDDPNPVEDTTSEMICDYETCICDPPTVWDHDTVKCVPLEECPKKE